MTYVNISGRTNLYGETFPFLLRFLTKSLPPVVDINYYLFRFSNGLSSSSFKKV